MVYKRIILDVELPDDYDESKIDKALENAIKNKKGKVRILRTLTYFGA